MRRPATTPRTVSQQILDTPPTGLRSKFCWRCAARGFLLGSFLGMGAWTLGFSRLLHSEDLVLLPGLAGALLGVTRFRRVLWLLSVAQLGAFLVLGYTPLAPALVRQAQRRDAPQVCPAVVVLSATVQKDGSLSAHSQDRVLQGYALLRSGYAPRLVLTQGNTLYGAQAPTVREQMRWLGLDYPVEETGPVSDTHDEALAVAALARERGWRRVLLVTHSWHMRRAAALFEKAGLPVLCCPCKESEYDLNALDNPPARIRAFVDWLHEIIGYQAARWRGWL